MKKLKQKDVYVDLGHKSQQETALQSKGLYSLEDILSNCEAALAAVAEVQGFKLRGGKDYFVVTRGDSAHPVTTLFLFRLLRSCQFTMLERSGPNYRSTSEGVFVRVEDRYIKEWAAHILDRAKLELHKTPWGER